MDPTHGALPDEFGVGPLTAGRARAVTDEPRIDLADRLVGDPTGDLVGDPTGDPTGDLTDEADLDWDRFVPDHEEDEAGPGGGFEDFVLGDSDGATEDLELRWDVFEADTRDAEEEARSAQVDAVLDRMTQRALRHAEGLGLDADHAPGAPGAPGAPEAPGAAGAALSTDGGDEGENAATAFARLEEALLRGALEEDDGATESLPEEWLTVADDPSVTHDEEDVGDILREDVLRHLDSASDRDDELDEALLREAEAEEALMQGADAEEEAEVGAEWIPLHAEFEDPGVLEEAESWFDDETGDQTAKQPEDEIEDRPSHVERDVSAAIPASLEYQDVWGDSAPEAFPSTTAATAATATTGFDARDGAGAEDPSEAGRIRLGKKASDQRRLVLLACLFFLVVLGAVVLHFGHTQSGGSSPAPPRAPTSASPAQVARLESAITDVQSASSGVQSGLTNLALFPTPPRVATMINPYVDSLHLYDTLAAGVRVPAPAQAAARSAETQVRSDIAFLQTINGLAPIQLGAFITSFLARSTQLEETLGALQHALTTAAP